MIKKKKFFILCDSNSSSGLGHLVRCISLAEELTNIYHIVFLGDYSETAQRILTKYQQSYLLQTAVLSDRILLLPENSLVIIDSYQLQTSMLRSDLRLILIDDFCELNAYPVDGVINFTINAVNYNYCLKGAKNQALGLDYYLPHPAIKKQYLSAKPEVRKILIIIGSGDQYGIANRLLDFFESIECSYDFVVLGTNNALDCKSRPFKVTHIPMTTNIIENYSWADLCITSGGLAKYECAYLGKPSLVISLTENELLETSFFAAYGFCYDAGLYSELKKNTFLKHFQSVLSESKVVNANPECSLRKFSKNSAERAATFVVDCFS
jgi:spore coat polysaccharide biosynthesis predicted glycosyltransferase SpsG